MPAAKLVRSAVYGAAPDTKFGTSFPQSSHREYRRPEKFYTNSSRRILDNETTQKDYNKSQAQL